MNKLYEIIKRPVISEKSTLQGEASGLYTFEVAPWSNKQEIGQALEKLFKVKVKSVRTMMMHGKYKRTGRFVSKRSNWKKALVTLQEGHKIEFFQGV